METERMNLEMLNCPICLTNFKNPRILPCLHSVCEKCLRVNIEKLESSGQFTCPLCKLPVIPSNAKLTVDSWINGFIQDGNITFLMDVSAGPENKDDRCDPCKREGENTTAEIWCEECKEKLCGPCVKYHKRSKLSTHHITVPVDEMEIKHPDMNFERTCARHPGKPLELFCVDHRELCCVLCFASNHRECINIRGIDDVVKDHAKLLTDDKITEDLRMIKTEMEKIIMDKNKNAAQLAQEAKHLFTDMDNQVHRIIEKLNELRISFKDKGERFQNKATESLLQSFNNIQGFVANVVNSCRILENVKERGSLRQKFITFETIRSQITSHHLQLKGKLNGESEMHLTLKPNKVLQEIEKSNDFLGEVEIASNVNSTMENSLQNINDSLTKMNSHTQMSSSVRAAQVQKSDLMTSPVTLVKKVERNIGDKTFINGGAFLVDGRLILADYNEKQLLQLDDFYDIVREHKIDGRPIDVAVGNNQNEIYISLFKHGNYIYRCILDSELTITKKIRAPSRTWGIAVSGDYIIACSSTAVVFLSEDGSAAKSIPKSEDYCYVAVSHNTPATFCHKDGESIVSRTYAGYEMFRYESDEMKSIRGICVDGQNNIYVCDLDSQNLRQISSDGRRSRILLDKLQSISQPTAVLFNVQKNELVVTSHKERTVLEVYKLG